MSPRPSVLLIDDSRLAGVHDVLLDLGAEVTIRRTPPLAERALGYSMFVSTAHTALDIGPMFEGTAHWLRPTWVAFHSQDFLPLRERLRKIDVDFLVHPNIDPEVLRLLLLRALYSGTEKRGSLRVPVGSRVTVESGDTAVSAFSATLLEIGPGGCRLSSEAAVAQGAAVVVGLPSALGDGEPVWLAGHVVREDPPMDFETQRTMAVRFEASASLTVSSLEALREGRAVGTAVTRLGDEESDAAPLIVEQLGEIQLPKKERRVLPRAAFVEQLVGFVSDATQVLFARDLSLEGVRVEPRGDLRAGDRIGVAIAGSGSQDPLLIQSIVTRSHASEDFVLRFDSLNAAQRQRLERMIASLPPVEWLGDEIGEANELVLLRAVIRPGA
jgi:hypothetical protein